MKKICAIILLAIVISSCNDKFNEVKIGDQIWMAENLNVESFRNGDLIPEAKTKSEWKKAGDEGKPAWCYYQYDPENGKKYGKLYNWYAVDDRRGLAPEGWSIPSLTHYDLLEAEVRKMKDVYGEINKSAGSKLKSKEGWRENNGTNESNFNALPGGYVTSYGTFENVGEKAYWWTFNEVQPVYLHSYSETQKEHHTPWAYSVRLKGGNGFSYREYYSKSLGFSVRCIKDN